MDRDLTPYTRLRWIKAFARDWQLFVFLLPLGMTLILFQYAPMFGVQIAFKNYKAHLGIWESPWVGLKHFRKIIEFASFRTILWNTLTLSLYSMVTFVLPIFLAVMVHSCSSKRLGKLVQNVAYAPHFVSIVVTVAILNSMFAPSTGVIRTMLMRLGLIEGYLELLQSADAFKHLYVWSGVWQNLGWDSIIYLSALAGVDVALHESAMIDGASKFKRILHIDLPSILPTVIILLILRVGAMMSVGYEKAYLMQNALNLGASEIISTYVYKQGIGQGNWSYATAVGLFNSVINFVMLTLVNALARRFSEHSLW